MCIVVSFLGAAKSALKFNSTNNKPHFKELFTLLQITRTTGLYKCIEPQYMYINASTLKLQLLCTQDFLVECSLMSHRCQNPRRVKTFSDTLFPFSSLLLSSTKVLKFLTVQRNALYRFGWVHGAVPVWLGTWYCTGLVEYMMLYQFGWVHGACYYRSWSFRSAVLFAILLYVTENETINESRLFRILHLAQVHLAPICTQYIVSNFTVLFST